MPEVRLNVDVRSVKTAAGAPVIPGVSFSVAGRGLLWLQGTNGAGKSILGSLIAGRMQMSSRHRLVPDADIAMTLPSGKVIAASSEHISDYVGHVAYLPQRIGESLLAIHHQDDFCFALEGRYQDLTGTTRNDKDDLAVRQLQLALDRLSAWGFLTRRLGQSSYGETRRIELACALLSVPETGAVVVLDEPFSGLDKGHRETLAVLLMELSQSAEWIWVVTSHESPSSFGIDLDAPRIVELPDPVGTPELFSLAVEHAEGLHSESLVDNDCNPLKVEYLTLHWARPHDRVVHLRDFSAAPGKVTWIEGANGAGKSSLLLALSGILRSSGLRGVTVAREMSCSENPTAGARDGDRCRLLMQSPYRSYAYSTIEEDLAHVTRQSHTLERGDASGCEKLAELEPSLGDLDRPARQLSFGQLRALQTFLVPSDCRFLFFDEPLLGLHPACRKRMLDALQALASGNRIVICSTETGCAPDGAIEVHHLTAEV